MSNITNESKRPTHTIYQVIGEGEKTRWIRIGAAWPNRDGKGFNLKFDAYPATGRTVIREVSEDKNEATGVSDDPFTSTAPERSGPST
ncbi:hypothetical protein [Bradyrhizobium sp.]|uniref:hypothetical protein n=1 Tax=Bradyrhizobium sp. TaxID=376 RepID=UPI0039E54DA4